MSAGWAGVKNEEQMVLTEKMYPLLRKLFPEGDINFSGIYEKVFEVEVSGQVIVTNHKTAKVWLEHWEVIVDGYGVGPDFTLDKSFELAAPLGGYGTLKENDMPLPKKAPAKKKPAGKKAKSLSEAFSEATEKAFPSLDVVDSATKTVNPDNYPTPSTKGANEVMSKATKSEQAEALKQKILDQGQGVEEKLSEEMANKAKSARALLLQNLKSMMSHTSQRDRGRHGIGKDVYFLDRIADDLKASGDKTLKTTGDIMRFGQEFFKKHNKPFPNEAERSKGRKVYSTFGIDSELQKRAGEDKSFRPADEEDIFRAVQHPDHQNDAGPIPVQLADINFNSLYALAELAKEAPESKDRLAIFAHVADEKVVSAAAKWLEPGKIDSQLDQLRNLQVTVNGEPMEALLVKDATAKKTLLEFLQEESKDPKTGKSKAKMYKVISVALDVEENIFQPLKERYGAFAGEPDASNSKVIETLLAPYLPHNMDDAAFAQFMLNEGRIDQARYDMIMKQINSGVFN